MADYDLDDIADKIAAKFQGLATDTYNGEAWTITSSGDISGVVNVPAVVVELDDVTYDLTMGRGEDNATFLVHLIVSSSDSASGQRLTRKLLSSGHIKDSINGLDVHGEPLDRTLGGTVSYAQMTGTRTIGTINYNGVSYLGASLEVLVVVQ